MASRGESGVVRPQKEWEAVFGDEPALSSSVILVGGIIAAIPDAPAILNEKDRS